MHLDTRIDLAHGPLAPPEWTMEFRKEEGMFTGVVKERHLLRCQISIAADDLSEADARTQLAEKARHWIAEYRTRRPLQEELGDCSEA